VKLKIVQFVCVLALLAEGACMLHSQPSTTTDTQQINALIHKLIAHEDPQQLLDPTVSEQRRIEELRHFANNYTITLTPEEVIQVSGQTATVPARLNFKSTSATSSEEKEYSTHLNFVSRNGQWYFADYDFLNTSVGAIFVFGMAMFLIAIWLGGTLLKWRSLREYRTGPFKASEAISDYFRAVNPFTWFRKEEETE